MLWAKYKQREMSIDMNSIEINLLCGDGGTGGDFSDISLMMKIESYFTLVEFAVGETAPMIRRKSVIVSTSTVNFDRDLFNDETLENIQHIKPPQPPPTQ